jgi:hypothetical protein
VRTNSTVLCLSILTLATLSLGCGGGARQASVSAWQKNVEQYVRVQGKGDPAVLRDLTLSDSRRGFAVVGSDRPSESTDANGVLIGFREIDGRGYFIYLVGVVERQRVKEIRLAALTTDGGRWSGERARTARRRSTRTARTTTRSGAGDSPTAAPRRSSTSASRRPTTTSTWRSAAIA